VEVAIEARAQIELSFFAERFVGLPVFGVERNQARIECGKEHPSRARAFLRTGAPIRYSAADHQIPEAPALVDLGIERPDLASGLWVESDHAVERCRKNEASVDDDRRCLERRSLERIRPSRSNVAVAIAPCDLEARDVRAVDL
jgi:hypothetical protein